MPLKRSLPPFAPTSKTLLEWATRMHEFVTDVGVEAAVQPQSVLLRHQVPSQLSRATENGILEFDPVTKTPLISIDGVWQPIMIAPTIVYEILAVPLVVADTDGLVDVITLSIADLPANTYVANVSFVTEFTFLNDQVHWNIIGDLVSPIFLKEAKDADEIVPFAFLFPFIWAGGPFSITLQVEVSGSGPTSAIIQAANLYVIKQYEP